MKCIYKKAKNIFKLKTSKSTVPIKYNKNINFSKPNYSAMCLKLNI